LLTARLIKEIKTSEVVWFFERTFIFFLNNINIEITPKKAHSYGGFILDEIRKTLMNIEIESI
jgi:hypothetical protein